MIEFDSVSYKYSGKKKIALKEINLTVAQGEFLAVVGGNDSGKTTFCKLINGIIPHNYDGELTGSVWVDGQNTKELSVPVLAEKTGIVLDDMDTQLFTSTVFAEAAFGPENLKLDKKEIISRVDYALRAVGLSGFEDRAVATLSGGEKQRLAIAAALAMKGKILILDEPLCRLDAGGAADVLRVLKELRDNHGVTVVVTACEREAVAGYADRIFALNEIEKNSHGAHKGSRLATYKWSDIRAQRREDHVFSYDNKQTLSLIPQTLKKEIVIKVSNFSYKYSVETKIENIDFTIYENDFIALIGKNGCGKTTLLKNITGLLRSCGGEIFIRGKNAKNLSVSEISKEIGFVMQNPASQLFTDSVFDEVAFALKKMKVPKKEIQNRAQEALKIVGLENIDAFPHSLSKSDRTKLVVACVLAMGCKILIFDEVDAGLDNINAHKIMNIMRNLHNKGFTIIFISHNMTLVSEYANRVIKMERNGVILIEDTTEQINR